MDPVKTAETAAVLMPGLMGCCKVTPKPKKKAQSSNRGDNLIIAPHTSVWKWWRVRQNFATFQKNKPKKKKYLRDQVKMLDFVQPKSTKRLTQQPLKAHNGRMSFSLPGAKKHNSQARFSSPLTPPPSLYRPHSQKREREKKIYVALYKNFSHASEGLCCRRRRHSAQPPCLIRSPRS